MEDKYDRIREAVETHPSGIKDLMNRNKYKRVEGLDFNPYPCHRCGELVECGIMAAADHFDVCKKNKIII